MNYISEVAKMLGVEIGEEFYIKEQPDIKCTIYNDGLYVFPIQDCICTLPSCEVTLVRLLRGVITIKRKPWKPKVGEMFWHINHCGEKQCWRWENGVDEYLNYYKLGNCYRTAEEAKANHDKWTTFYASDEVLEV